MSGVFCCITSIYWLTWLGERKEGREREKHLVTCQVDWLARETWSWLSLVRPLVFLLFNFVGKWKDRQEERERKRRKKERKQCRHGEGFEHSMLALNHSPTETREGGGWVGGWRGYTRLEAKGSQRKNRWNERKCLLKILSWHFGRLWSIYYWRLRCLSLVIDVRWLCRSCWQPPLRPARNAMPKSPFLLSLILVLCLFPCATITALLFISKSCFATVCARPYRFYSSKREFHPRGARAVLPHPLPFFFAASFSSSPLLFDSCQTVLFFILHRMIKIKNNKKKVKKRRRLLRIHHE